MTTNLTPLALLESLTERIGFAVEWLCDKWEGTNYAQEGR